MPTLFSELEQLLTAKGNYVLRTTGRFLGRGFPEERACAFQMVVSIRKKIVSSSRTVISFVELWRVIGYAMRNGSGRDISGFHRGNWLHSDMKDMAYFYVFKLYDQLVEKGQLE